MQKTVLGRTGLEVSVAGLGCGGHSRLGKLQGKPFEHSVSIVRTALDLGVTFIDTAAAYETEDIVAAAIRGRRDGLVISTKVSVVAGDFFKAGELVDPDELERRVDGCLRRLDTDMVDILHLHGISLAQYDYCSTVLYERLQRIREAGKIRFLGLTERFGSETDHSMAERATADGLFDVIMIGLNYVNHTALRKVLPQARATGLGTLCMFAVRGVLGDRTRAAALVDKLVDAGEVDPSLIDREDPVGFLIAPGVASSLAEAAYRFCRHSPGIDVTITGTGSDEHLRQNLRAINMPPLPQETLDRITAIFGAVTSESGEPRRENGDTGRARARVAPPSNSSTVQR